MVKNNNNFDEKLFNLNNDKVFKNKKFYCFSPTKDENDKSIKDNILKLIEIHGGTVQYCVSKFSTDLIILCNSRIEYNKNESFYSIQNNLISNFEKYKNYKINILTYSFILESIKSNKVIENFNGYLIEDLKEENNILNISISKNVEEEYSMFFDNNYFDDNSSISTYSNNNNNNKNKNYNGYKSSEASEGPEMHDLFDFGFTNDDDQINEISSTKSWNGNLNKKKEKIKEEEEEEEEEEEYEEMFDLFGFDQNKEIKEDIVEDDFQLFDIGYDFNNNNSNINNNNNSNSYNTPKINNLYDNNSFGYLFQFINTNPKIFEQLPKELQNQEFKSFKQNSKGFTNLITKSNKNYCWGDIKTMKIEKLESFNINQSSNGQDHCVIIRNNYNKNDCFVFGLNNFKQLGMTNEELQKKTNYLNQFLTNESISRNCNLKIFNLDNFNEIKIKYISCGKNFTILLDDQSNLYSFGQNDYGQLGIGNTNETKINMVQSVKKPIGLINQNISYISSGDNHTVLITQNHNDNVDEYYGWGSNLQGQINVKFSSEPTHIQYYNAECFSSKLFCYGDSTIIVSKSNKIEQFGIQNDLLCENLTNYFNSNQQYQLIQFRNKIGILVFDPFSIVKLFINSINYQYNSHFKICLKIVKKSIELEDAVKLVTECFIHSNLPILQALETKFSKKLFDRETKQNPFHLASEYCNSDESLKLLEFLFMLNRYSIDQQDTNLNTPIHLSVLKLNFKVVNFLLTKGCNRNSKNRADETPLHLSVKFGKSVAMSSLLCKHGAQSIPDRVMKTPLQYCIGNDEKQNLQNIIFTNQVFISYAHKDSGFVNNLRNLFGLSSLRCWLDEYRLQAGCNWRAEITKGVENSNVVVFVVSETSVQSLWCRKELKMSKRLGKIILPLFLQPNVYIDPTLYGLFTIIPKQSKTSYKEMSESEVQSNVKSLSNVINSLLRNGSGGQFNQSTSDSLLEKYQIEKSIYFTFNAIDRILVDFLKESIIEKNHLPLISNDEINGKPNQHLDQFSEINLKKEKQKSSKIRSLKQQHENQLSELLNQHKKQLWKLSRKIDKKIEKYQIQLGNHQQDNYSDYFDVKEFKLNLEKQLNIDQIKRNHLIEINNLKNSHIKLLNSKFNLNLELLNDDSLNQVDNYNNFNNNEYDTGHFNNSIFYNSNQDTYYSKQENEEKELEIPILNSYISSDNYNNDNDNNDNNNNYQQEYQKEQQEYQNNNDSDNNDNNNEKELNNFNINLNNLNYLKNCLLHLVLFTKKTIEIDMELYLNEIHYSSSLNKTIVIITNDISLKDLESTPSSLKDLTWYEIENKNINQVFDNIILIYDILEKTNQINNQIKSFNK